jgi:hypothetical protein
MLRIASVLILVWLVSGGRAESQSVSGQSEVARPGAGIATETKNVPQADTKAAFPLTVASGNRYLANADGKPFLIHGDTAWSLIADLTRENVERYLSDRRARGFNTLLISLIEHKFATKAPANAYGQLPFQPSGDFASPNEEYFAHADSVLRRAAEYGFLVLLTPSYAGANGGDEGWYRAMIANGPEKLRRYGQFLGNRYRDFGNILWVHGGDYKPPNKAVVNAIAEGIREADPKALHTAHASPETSAVAYWQGEPWLAVNTVYTYRPVYFAALREFSRRERMPFFLIESAYENEHDATELRVRTQAYHALLSGAAGHVFGNNPIWHFDGPGVHPAAMSWQESLASRGAQSMTYLRNLFARLSWWLLEPDVNNSFLSGDLGYGQDHTVAARATDRSFGLIYFPSARTVKTDLGLLAGPMVTAHWYDPANGQFSEVTGSPFRADGVQKFRPMQRNSSGFGDWVLLLKSHS